MPSTSTSTQRAPPRNSRKRTVVLNSDDQENHVPSHHRNHRRVNHGLRRVRRVHPVQNCVKISREVNCTRRSGLSRRRPMMLNGNFELWSANWPILPTKTTSRRGGAGPRGKVLYGGSDEDTTKIKLLAHKCAIMGTLWLHDLNRMFNTAVDSQYDPLGRFQNRTSKIQGELADLLVLLPDKFHGEIMSSEWLIKTTGLDQRKESVLRIFHGASDEDHKKEKQSAMDLLRDDEEE
ncbi:hypothetical protein DFH06DRAFT_1136118 [Mycena polygramma]|nr:hypothetical protein DFH06DRAFT_1136118 [Mycena polygramma]